MRVLEISRPGLFKALLPEGTVWVRWGTPLTAQEQYQPQPLTLRRLLDILWSLRAKTFDLIVLPSVHPDHSYDQPRFKVGAKHALEGIASSPAAALLHRLIGSTAYVIMDIRDETCICETSIRLFPHHLWYFKRELDFSQTTRLSKVRPLPLFLPDEHQVAAPVEKSIDLLFAGTVCNEIRAKALEAARRLADRGFRVLLPTTPLPYAEFMAAMARSWLVLSPEGYGWDCYRHYEACLAFSVPVINLPSYRRKLYLEQDMHCLYYDPHRDDLVAFLVDALGRKDRLERMARAGHLHVLAQHTRSALARYILRECTGGESQPTSIPALGYC